MCFISFSSLDSLLVSDNRTNKENLYNRLRHCSFHIGCKRLRTRIATDLCVRVLGSLKLTTIGTKSCLLLRLQTALKSDEGDLRKWGASNTESTNRLSTNKATETVPDFSPRPTDPNGLLASFLTKTSHIEIHDEAPVNVASLFFKILQTIAGLPTFRSFALNRT